MKSRLAIACLLVASSAIAAAGPKGRVVGRVAIPAPSPVIADAPWSVEITSSGGFTGMGSGNVRIDSDGKLAIGVFKPGRCEFIVPAGELAEIGDAVSSLRSDLWFASYVPADVRLRCCDLITLDVKVTRSETNRATGQAETGVYETSLLAHPTPLSIPKDLSDLVARLFYAADSTSFLQRYLPACKP